MLAPKCLVATKIDDDGVRLPHPLRESRGQEWDDAR